MLLLLLTSCLHSVCSYVSNLAFRLFAEVCIFDVLFANSERHSHCLNVGLRRVHADWKVSSIPHVVWCQP